VYTHKSLGRDDTEHGERLRVLGEKAFRLAVMAALFKHRPMLTALEIEVG
jgi:dsRNA-specific ribonuclease